MNNRSDNNKNACPQYLQYNCSRRGYTHQNFPKKISGGYTIIETMISVSLFVIIVMISMGALLNANLLSEKSKNMRSIIDNLSFVMEEMSRNLRIGGKYYCIAGSDDLSNISIAKSGSNCWGVAFNPFGGGDQWVYYISNDGKIFKSIDGATSFVQLTPDEIVIDPASSFSVLGAEPPSAGNNEQPLVTIKLVGKITYKNIESPFSLQTSMSQRIIDI